MANSPKDVAYEALQLPAPVPVRYAVQFLDSFISHLASLVASLIEKRPHPQVEGSKSMSAKRPIPFIPESLKSKRDEKLVGEEMDRNENSPCPNF
jgi:hypothetical protein